MTEDHQQEHNRIYERIDRMDAKLDKLVDAMTSFARVEEKIALDRMDRERMGKRLGDLEEWRRDKADPALTKLGIFFAGFSKVGLAVVTLIVLGILGGFWAF